MVGASGDLTGATAAPEPDAAQSLWAVLETVPDPEVPALSVVDLGIVREIRCDAQGWVVTVTPTYSGCPATKVIAEDIRAALAAHGFGEVRVQMRLAPAWTTDWLSVSGREKLRRFGIAPPVHQVVDVSALSRQRRLPVVPCPLCLSSHTELISEFGSTSCKALYRCLDCREPFDYFKSH
ncbi:MAG: 1,2-phenylacetyl-CoA epoxidase subunit PaaD [Burkholderiaceae bacterium]|jgi:ring-1,2-phenylacetyl-CoA epoxidase subunit PaaD